jgi:hypothetical protein
MPHVDFERAIVQADFRMIFLKGQCVVSCLIYREVERGEEIQEGKVPCHWRIRRG